MDPPPFPQLHQVVQEIVLCFRSGTGEPKQFLPEVLKRDINPVIGIKNIKITLNPIGPSSQLLLADFKNPAICV